MCTRKQGTEMKCKNLILFGCRQVAKRSEPSRYLFLAIRGPIFLLPSKSNYLPQPFTPSTPVLADIHYPALCPRISRRIHELFITFPHDSSRRRTSCIPWNFYENSLKQARSCLYQNFSLLHQRPLHSQYCTTIAIDAK